MDAIFKEGMTPWMIFERDQLENYEPSPSDARSYVSQLSIQQDTAAANATMPTLADESYTLSISGDGQAKITSKSTFGTLHALQTFVQLFYTHSDGKDVYTKLAPATISDKPKFSHRGLNLDVARNFFPVKDIERTIDALSMNKFNVLHLHMTDSQSWPMEIPALPQLAQKGAYNRKQIYSTDDIQHIQEYALARGVAVYIEFDMPGHTGAIGYAYPDLVAAMDARPWIKYCAEPPCGTLQLNNPAVYRFLDKLFDDVLPRVKEYTPYFHTGGDEVAVESYTLDPTVKSQDKNVIRPLIQKLVDYTHAKIREQGLAPVVWEEMLVGWSLNLGKDVVVQAWHGADVIGKSVAAGHKTIAGSPQ